MKNMFTLSLVLLSILPIGYSSNVRQNTNLNPLAKSISPISPASCTSFCLDIDDHCVFGANMDNSLESGYLFVNKRHVLKNTWDPSTTGEYARWISKYGSVTINFVSYQMVWGGMNESGLMISTMSLNKTQGPGEDERLPFQSPFWMQHQLDTYSTVEEVIASDSTIRLPESQIDHYLVCDRTGQCAVIEFIEGRMVHYLDESLPVKALTNSTYESSLLAREEIHRGMGEGYGDSIQRFVEAANRLSKFTSTENEDAVEYAFDTLEAVSRQDTVWSFVYDPVNLHIDFRSNRNPQIRSLDFQDLDFSCRTPVKMIDVHANLSGDISDDLIKYNHALSLSHGTIFFTQYEGFSMPPFLVDTLLRGVESFPCKEGKGIITMDLERYHPLIPPTIVWAGLTVLYRFGLVWTLLIGVSIACLLWFMGAEENIPKSKRLIWIIITVVLGPVGLAIHIIARNRNQRTTEAA